MATGFGLTVLILGFGSLGGGFNPVVSLRGLTPASAYRRTPSDLPRRLQVGQRLERDDPRFRRCLAQLRSSIGVKGRLPTRSW